MKLTPEEAAFLVHIGGRAPEYLATTLFDAGLIDNDWLITDLGREILAEHLLEQRRQIRAEAIGQCVAAMRRLSKRMHAMNRRAATNQVLAAIKTIETEVTP